MEMYTLLYLKWKTNKDRLCSTQNAAQCYVAAWMGGKSGGEWMHVYVQLSPFAILLKPSQHCELAIPLCCCYCSVAHLCLTLCNPMDCSTPGLCLSLYKIKNLKKGYIKK